MFPRSRQDFKNPSRVHRYNAKQSCAEKRLLRGREVIGSHSGVRPRMQEKEKASRVGPRGEQDERGKEKTFTFTGVCRRWKVLKKAGPKRLWRTRPAAQMEGVHNVQYGWRPRQGGVEVLNLCLIAYAVWIRVMCWQTLLWMEASVKAILFSHRP
jgi:hypothetical protein